MGLFVRYTDIDPSKIIEKVVERLPFYVLNMERHQLVEIANYRMPYGKYKGYLLIQLPESYVVWYKGKGFPEGKLGNYLGIIYEIKVNGLEDLIYPLIEKK